jgi:hypothetical protein
MTTQSGPNAEMWYLREDNARGEVRSLCAELGEQRQLVARLSARSASLQKMISAIEELYPDLAEVS